MTTALLFSSNLRLRAGMSLGFDANGRAACSDFGITNGLNFLSFLSIGCNQDKIRLYTSKIRNKIHKLEIQFVA